MNFFRKTFGYILILSLLFFVVGDVKGEATKIGNESKNSSRLTISLNGKWEFEASNIKPETWRCSIAVPGLVDMAQPSINWQSHSYFWYKKTFTLTPAHARSHALIKIDQSMYGTEVWLNGISLGSYIGCYTSYKYNATKAINYHGENTLIVKVGAKATLSPDSAVGDDGEKVSFIPGIWGDVSLILASNPVIERVQVISHIDTTTAEARITVKNLESVTQNITISSRAFEKSTNNPVSDEITTNYNISPLEEKTLTLNLPITDMQLWSPDNPFLYNLVSKVKIADAEIDILITTFGMREFKIVGSDFYLNGHRVFLKGSNIAFHRFLSDPDREGLPWDGTWIKKILIDIPKAHNFNFFRNHLGQMYNRWYDIADEYGIMLQDEWAFGAITGPEGQIRQEFTQWLYDNCNHPSIIIWDALNEPYDDGKMSRNIIRDKIIPEMKKIDPTRPWECGLNCNVDFKSWHPIDFSEDHPYTYSLGPVLNKDNFGNSRSIEGIKNSNEPTMLDEFVWFWLDKNGDPASLTNSVLLRWLGNNSTSNQRLEYQAQLASDLVELWRRIGVDGIAPFVYLSINGAATSNWFTGDIANPGVKPIMAALKDAFAPFGLSIELWDRHFLAREERVINVYVFNDTTQKKSGILRCRIVDKNNTDIVNVGNYTVNVSAGQTLIKAISWKMPSITGTYYLKAEIVPDGKTEPVAISKKIAHVLNQPTVPSNLSDAKIMIYDPDNEILDYLTSLGLNAVTYDSAMLSQQDILILGEGALLDTNYNFRIEEITSFVKEGHSLIVIEPSYGITNYQKQDYPLLSNLSLSMNKREDKSEGGYDSYCFIEDPSFSLWNNIASEHLKMFNGGFGGEMVSECDVKLPTNRKVTLARSGLELTYSDVIETIWGEDVVVISHIQVRGRLTEKADPGTDLYSRRVDPVAQQYLLNLISTYLDTASHWKRINEALSFLYVKETSASSVQGDYSRLTSDKAIDNNLSTRWSSQLGDPQWICLDLGKKVKFDKVILYWETACGKSYKIQISDDKSSWTDVYSTTTGDGGVDEIRFDAVAARYVRMYGIERATEWGYSLYEFRVDFEKDRR